MARFKSLPTPLLLSSLNLSPLLLSLNYSSPTTTIPLPYSSRIPPLLLSPIPPPIPPPIPLPLFLSIPLISPHFSHITLLPPIPPHTHLPYSSPTPPPIPLPILISPTIPFPPPLSPYSSPPPTPLPLILRMPVKCLMLVKVVTSQKLRCMPRSLNSSRTKMTYLKSLVSFCLTLMDISLPIMC